MTDADPVDRGGDDRPPRDDRSDRSGGDDHSGRDDRIARGIELTPEHSLDRVTDLARRAAEAGFGTALVSCHYFNRDPFAAADRIARTTDLRVGPAAANPYDGHPVTLAARTATLQEASDGRAVFGIAPGDRSTLHDLGVDRERPLRRTLEAFEVARRLWRGERVDHDGTFRAAGAELQFAVDPPPVYVGAQGPDMLRMSAKRADGALINASHPRDLSWATDRIEEGLADRSEQGFDAVAYAAVSVADDGDRAREAARAPVAFVVGGAAPPVLERHGIDRDRADEVARLVERGELRAAFDAVTDPMIEAFAIAGEVDRVTERLVAAREHVDGVVVGAPLGPDLERAITLAGRAARRAERRS